MKTDKKNIMAVFYDIHSGDTTTVYASDMAGLLEKLGRVFTKEALNKVMAGESDGSTLEAYQIKAIDLPSPLFNTV